MNNLQSTLIREYQGSMYARVPYHSEVPQVAHLINAMRVLRWLDWGKNG